MHNAGFGGWVVVIVFLALLILAPVIVISKRANRKVGDALRSAEKRIR